MKLSATKILLISAILGGCVGEYVSATRHLTSKKSGTTATDSDTGTTDAETRSIPGCTDLPGWQDADGLSCSYYEQNRGYACPIEGDLYAGTDGKVANEACCICGGGTMTIPCDYDPTSPLPLCPNVCIDFDWWYDSGGPTYNCNYYEAAPTRCTTEAPDYPNFGMTAQQACCVCGGQCQDYPGWYDSGGPGYTCAWYAEAADDRCVNYGTEWENFGWTATEACCVCRGIPTPSPTTHFFEFHIDCYMADEAYTSTEDRIDVTFYDAVWNVLGTTSFDKLVCPPLPQDEAVGMILPTHADKVKVSASGNDALLIDMAWITIDGVEHNRWDLSGSYGWCLSYESLDYVWQGWEGNLIEDQCYARFVFEHSGNRVFHVPV